MSRQGDYREALNRIAKAKSEKATELDLSNLDIGELPDELFECTHLTKLLVNDCKLISLSSTIRELINLRSLFLISNSLLELPKEIGCLTKLQDLRVTNNRIDYLPEEIGNLTKLVILIVSNNHLTHLPRRIGNLLKLFDLDVSVNRIIQLPKEIGALLKLRSFNAFSNQLTQLPNEIGKLTELRDFDVSHNELAQLPKGIGYIVNLRELFIHNNKLTTLPNEITNLTNLQTLSMSDNSFARFPVQICDLAGLQYLNVNNNKLSQLPNQIGSLTNLRDLEIVRNHLTLLPDGIGNLDNLQNLVLTNNRLKHLPVQICDLNNLTYLSVSENQLESIPEEIGNLSKLKILDISNNQLSELPEGICELSELQYLYVDHNKLSHLANVIGYKVNLNILEISNNQLVALPNSLNKMKGIKGLYLHNNPELNIPPDILGPNYDKSSEEKQEPALPQKILEYYFRTRFEKKPLNEAKLILVGRGEVGKTSLVNRLMNNSFNLKQRKTDGIKISNWQIELKKKEKVRLNVWDFGGQEIMHATHQFFLTERSLYLLVLDGRGGLEDNDAEYWLKIISSFGAGSPVIIVLNKIKTHPFDLNRKALLDKYPFIKAFIKTDCKDGNGIEELFKEIKKQTDALENLRVPFPAAWFDIKEKIASMKQNYLSFAEFKQFCRNNGETEEGAQESIAYYLHQLGIALNYKDDPRLKEKHILNPFWLTQGIYKILNSTLLEKNNGEITEADISQILDKKKYPKDMHCFLLELMRKFELCFQTPKKENSYLIPELLGKQEPVTKDFVPEKCLNFQYSYPVLPPGLLPRFIVRTYTLSEGQKRWRSGVILQLEGCKALIRADVAEKKVTITINGSIEKRKNLLAVIRNDFERIHADIKNLQPDEMVPVPGYSTITIAYSKLLGLEWNGIEQYDEIIDGKLLKINVKELLNGIDFTKLKDGKIKIFISYCHKDERYKNQLETHLKILQRQNIISVWNDRRIIAGQEWETEIDRNLEDADIIILLISADFVASNYCYDIELKRAIEKHNKSEAVVIPVSVRKCNWSKAPFGKIQGLPKNAKPVKSFRDKDEAWTEISKAIENIAVKAVIMKQRTPFSFVELKGKK